MFAAEQLEQSVIKDWTPRLTRVTPSLAQQASPFVPKRFRDSPPSSIPAVPTNRVAREIRATSVRVARSLGQWAFRRRKKLSPAARRVTLDTPSLERGCTAPALRRAKHLQTARVRRAPPGSLRKTAAPARGRPAPCKTRSKDKFARKTGCAHRCAAAASPDAAELSIVPSPIKFTIAARLFRSIAFLLLGVGSSRAFALADRSALATGTAAATRRPTRTDPVSIVYRAHNPARDPRLSHSTQSSLGRWSIDSSSPSPTNRTWRSAWRSLVTPNDQGRNQDFRGRWRTLHHSPRYREHDRRRPGRCRPFPRDIIVWDKSLGGIKEAGYTDGEGYQLKSIPPRDGYDPKADLSPRPSWATSSGAILNTSPMAARCRC